MSVLLIAGYCGVFVFAVTGAMLAARKQMDIFGFVVLALMPAVGGGTLRDLILGVPVFWLLDTHYLLITFAAALLTFLGVRIVNRLNVVIVWLDALGLSVFCVLGASKTLLVVGDPVIAVMMGVITAVAGGILRDVIANEIPLVLHKEVYATAAFAGAVAFVLIHQYSPDVALIVGMLVAFGARALGIQFGLSLPAASGENDT